MKNKALLLAWVVFIFYLSSTTSIEVLDPKSWLNPTIYSHQVSLLDLQNKHCQFYWTYTEELGDIRQLGAEFFVRKIGHCILYGVLSLIVFSISKARNHGAVIAWSIATLIALLDEMNQYLMIGRSGRLMDVLLDSTAAVISIIIVLVISSLKKRIKLSMSYQN